MGSLRKAGEEAEYFAIGKKHRGGNWECSVRETESSDPPVPLPPQLVRGKSQVTKLQLIELSYRKIPMIISPGLIRFIFVQKAFLVGLFLG